MASLSQLSSQIADSDSTSERTLRQCEPSGSPSLPIAEPSDEGWSWGGEAVRLHAAGAASGSGSSGHGGSRGGSRGSSGGPEHNAEAEDEIPDHVAAAFDASANSDGLPEPFAAVVSALRTGRPFAISGDPEAAGADLGQDAADRDDAELRQAELEQDVMELEPEASSAAALADAATEVDDADVTEIVALDPEEQEAAAADNAAAASPAVAPIEIGSLEMVRTEEADVGATASMPTLSATGSAPGSSAAPASAARADSNPLPAVPAERVRFAVPITVEVGGSGAGGNGAHEGAILNLSDSGVGCVLPVQLPIGTRVTMRFRPGLAEQPLCVAGEVVWHRQQGERWLYGVSFGGVSPAEAARIAAVVRERAEGRAGEWPLPVVPAQRGLGRRSSVWLTAAGAFVAGAAVSFVLAGIPNRTSSPDVAPAVSAADETVPGGAVSSSGAPAATASALMLPAVAAPAPHPEATASAAGPSAPAAATAAESAEPAASGATATSPRAAEPGAAKTLSPAAAAAATAAPATSAATSRATTTQGASEGRQSVTAAAAPSAPEPNKPATPGPARKEPASAVNGRDGSTPTWRASARGLELTLYTTGGVATVNSFWLDNPRRFVIDVEGARSATTSSEVMVQQSLLRRVRVGNHPDKVRFVLEVTDKTAPEVEVRAEGSAIRVSLHAR